MSRRRRVLSLSLFPFLAVLVCTMGTLILLLALVTRDAKKQAKISATAKAEAAAQAAVEVRDWQRDQLLAIRQKQTEDLERRRSQLAHVEDHLQRLDQELRALTDRIVASKDENSVTEFEKEIAQLQAKAKELQSKAEQNKAAADSNEPPPRVAILPYRGPNGTVRRPIYVECVGDFVVIQPEGVKLPMKVLRGPLGPGNPLDAALRAARLHWQQFEPTPPYPLLVVRPSGVVAYAAARVAMTAWDDQFGYELVPDDIDLVFPDADADLHRKMQLALDDAIQRRSTLIAAMPERFSVGGNMNSLDRAIEEAAQENSSLAQDPLNQYRKEQTAPTNAMASGGTAGVFTNQSGTTGGGQGSGSFASANGGDVSAGGNGGSADLPLMGPQAGSSTGNGNGLGMLGSQTKASPPLDAGLESPSSSRMQGSGVTQGHVTGSLPQKATPGTFATNRTPGSPSSFGGGDGIGESAAGPSESVGGDPLAGRSGQSADKSTSNLNDSNQKQAAASGAAGSAPGGGAPGYVAGGSPGGTNMASSTSDSTQGNTAEGPQTSSSSSSSVSSPTAGTAPLASKRGRDWALPDNAKTSGPSVVRHFHVQCYPDRYELDSSSGLRTRIPIDPNNRSAAVLRVAAAVRTKVESWGPALAGGRWQPVLLADVAPDGGEAYLALSRLMEGSGVMVKQGSNP
jgi:uncharacterized protein YoxC